MDKENRRMMTGIIVGDHKRCVLVTMYDSKPYVTDHVIAEALAVLYEVVLSYDMGVQNVIFGVNALEIVHPLNPKGRSWGLYGQVIHDVEVMLKHLQGQQMRHVRREVNETTHKLAKEAVHQMEEHVWIEAFPTCIQEIVRLEHTVIS